MSDFRIEPSKLASVMRAVSMGIVSMLGGAVLSFAPSLAGAVEVRFFSELDSQAREAVENLASRAEMIGVNAPPPRRIAVLNREGEILRVDTSRFRKALTSGVLRAIAAGGICDLEVSGPCLVVEDRELYAIAAIRNSEGWRAIVEGGFDMRSGYANASFARFKAILKRDGRGQAVLYARDHAVAQARPVEMPAPVEELRWNPLPLKPESEQSQNHSRAPELHSPFVYGP